MRTALEYYGGAAPGHKMLLQSVKTWLDNLPEAPSDVNPERLWSCHIIARAVRLNFKITAWEVVDGFFTKGVQHSWLAIGVGENKLVLDVYPVASLGCPIIVDAGSRASPWSGFYIKGDYAPNLTEGYDRQAEQLLGMPVV